VLFPANYSCSCSQLRWLARSDAELCCFPANCSCSCSQLRWLARSDAEQCCFPAAAPLPHSKRLGLARTVYTHTVQDSMYGDFPAKHTVCTPYISITTYRMYTVYTPYKYMVLAHICLAHICSYNNIYLAHILAYKYMVLAHYKRSIGIDIYGSGPLQKVNTYTGMVLAHYKSSIRINIWFWPTTKGQTQNCAFPLLQHSRVFSEHTHTHTHTHAHTHTHTHTHTPM